MTSETKTPSEGGAVDCVVVGCLLEESGDQLAGKISQQLTDAAKFSPGTEMRHDEGGQKRRNTLRRIMWLNITSMVLALMSLAIALS